MSFDEQFDRTLASFENASSLTDARAGPRGTGADPSDERLTWPTCLASLHQSGAMAESYWILASTINETWKKR